MVKFTDTEVVFDEVPDKVTLAINISNCPNRCPGCHSPELRGNIGEELTEEVIDTLIKENDGINCVGFMGEGNDKPRLIELALYTRNKYPNLETCIYSGKEEESDEVYAAFDYVKTGPYIISCGPLNVETTNQRMYHVGKDGSREDITYKFWKKLQ
jgi:anaerobic ribonucleoside-triphosphate reductase activating protein